MARSVYLTENTRTSRDRRKSGVWQKTGTGTGPIKNQSNVSENLVFGKGLGCPDLVSRGSLINK